jgi:beta-phosphoglucomutase
MFKAILFDLNGTMINDMEYHTKAWFDILNNDLQANLSIEEVRKEMYGKNAELLVRVFGDKKFTIDEMDRLSLEKEKRYQKAFFPELKLIEGLDRLLALAKAKDIKMAVASAAIPFNINFVLDNLSIRHYFGAIVSANDVTTSKPHPETFLKAAALLGIPPEECIVFEDVPKGVEAAQNAGMKAIVITTMHQKEEFEKYNNIIAFAKDYTAPIFQEILSPSSPA